MYLFPSLNLVQTIENHSHLKLSSNRAGETFWFESADPQYISYHFQDIPLAQVKSSRFFGAISLYAKDYERITGFSKVQKKFLKHPKQNVLVSDIKIKTRPLENPSSIRIPTSFFDNLQKVGEDQIQNERILIRSTILNDTPKDDFCMETELPVKSVRTSQFGSYRRLPTGLQYFHTGLDLRARTGTPIYAMADGEVSLSQFFNVPGNAVIVDHGNSIFSKYFHLSDLAVTPGQQIKKGDLIGKAGATGRVEAAHLHWEVTWKGIVTDPQAFMNTMKTACL